MNRDDSERSEEGEGVGVGEAAQGRPPRGRRGAGKYWGVRDKGDREKAVGRKSEGN